MLRLSNGWLSECSVGLQTLIEAWDSALKEGTTNSLLERIMRLLEPHIEQEGVQAYEKLFVEIASQLDIRDPHRKSIDSIVEALANRHGSYCIETQVRIE